MSLSDLISNTGQRIRNDGWRGIKETVYMTYVGAWRICGSRLPMGTNIFERDWDILVLLDGCRVDTMREVSKQFDSRPKTEELVSVGSTSREWLAKTFIPKYREDISRTAYITANPYSEEILSPGGAENSSPFNPANWDSLTAEELYCVEEVWRDHWDESLGTVPPRIVTEHGIQLARSEQPERVILHYMQPHQPFIGERARMRDQAFITDNCWKALHRGEASVDTIKQVYKENLGVVLEEIPLLRENMTGRLAVSSDHGNAFGEWGVFGHPNGFLHPAVKHVPWLEFDATDSGTYETSISDQRERGDVETATEERLQDLGYL